MGDWGKGQNSGAHGACEVLGSNPRPEITPRLRVTSFPQITRSEIMNYRSQLDEFARRFYRQGPGAVGEDLDKGEAVVWGC